MTGPEHYKEAERLLAATEKNLTILVERRMAGQSEPPASLVAELTTAVCSAQAHATLAQVAATMDHVGATVNGVVSDGWKGVLS